MLLVCATQEVPSTAEVEVANTTMNNYNAPGSAQTPPQLIREGGGEETLRSEIHKLIMLIWNKGEFSHQWKVSIVVPIHILSH
jgi:hypothetical protein